MTLAFHDRVNFYKHHIGDYAKKTGALSLMEHGAYLLLLHAYYGTEKPLPIGRDLYRICRAFGKKERQSVDKVLSLFWTQTDAGWVNGRAFEEIEIAEKLRETAIDNGSKGGRPRKPTGLSEKNPPGSFSEPRAKAIQTPDSRLQTPNPTPTPPKGGARRQRRSPERAVKDRALEVYRELIASKGAKRDPKVQKALDAIGGWSRIQQRTDRDDPALRREFCDAYRECA